MAGSFLYVLDALIFFSDIVKPFFSYSPEKRTIWLHNQIIVKELLKDNEYRFLYQCISLLCHHR